MKKQRRFTTGILYSTSSFLSGAATVINLGGNYYNFNSAETEIEADSQALANDFNLIGQDFNDILGNVKDDKVNFLTLDF